MLSVVGGRPDQGKGLFGVHLATYVSQHGGRVLYSAAEDSFGKMTKPRLEAAGAKLENIHLWRFRLPTDWDRLIGILHDETPALLVMDPVASHMSGRHSDKIRQIVDPLADQIEQTNTAGVMIEHVIKNVSPNSHPLQAIGGSSSGLVSAARAAYIFGTDPNDPDKRILGHAKNNNRDKPPPVSFEIDTNEVELDHGEFGELPFLIYEKELDPKFNVISLVAGRGIAGVGPGRPADRRAEAAEWLANYLAAARKPVKSGQIIEDARKVGMSVKTLKRAADDMEVVRTPPGGGRNCTWDLSDEVKQSYGIPLSPTKDSIDEELKKLLGDDDAKS